MEDQIILPVRPIHATAIVAHLLIVLKQYISGKSEDGLSPSELERLSHINQACQKFESCAEGVDGDDETPLPVSLSPSEARAFARAFRDEALLQPALSDDFYARHDYESFYALIYEPYLEALEEGMVEG